jgi:predicted acetyltransferase
MPLEIRTLVEADLDAILVVDGAAFSQVPPEAERGPLLATSEWDRMFGAFEGDTLCGVVGAYGVEVTAPGPVTTPTSGVTAVGVLPTHRRRGILTSLMAHQFDDIAARGEALAILNASEATIYGRFGYGVASVTRTAEISRSRSGFVSPVAAGLPLRLLSRAQATELAPRWFEAHRRAHAGEINRPDTWWGAVFGEHESWKGGGEIFVVACEPIDDSVPGGYAVYKVRRAGPAGSWVLEVREVIAADAEVAIALWRYLLDVDLVAQVVAPAFAAGDPLRWRLADWRALHITEESDYLWVRIVDAAAALAQRRYRVADSLVVEISDGFRPAHAGRYRVSGDPSGAEGARTTDAPDLMMDVADLGSLYLGGVAATALARAGRIAEGTSGALARADLFFGSDPPPFCSTHF